MLIQKPHGLTYILVPSLIHHRPVQVRFHGKTSGLHLLGRSDRTDHRNEGGALCWFSPRVQLFTHFPVIGGVWHLPRAHRWPRAKDDVAHLLQEEHDVAMPPMHVQERLVDLYFTYMHPSLPMIHKTQFLADWRAIRNGYVDIAAPFFTAAFVPCFFTPFIHDC